MFDVPQLGSCQLTKRQAAFLRSKKALHIFGACHDQQQQQQDLGSITANLSCRVEKGDGANEATTVGAIVIGLLLGVPLEQCGRFLE